jgi:hypothetical protein
MKVVNRAFPGRRASRKHTKSVRAVAYSTYPRQPGHLVHEVDTHRVSLNYLQAE